MFKGPGGTILTIDGQNTAQKVLGNPTGSAYQAPKQTWLEGNIAVVDNEVWNINTM